MSSCQVKDTKPHRMPTHPQIFIRLFTNLTKHQYASEGISSWFPGGAIICGMYGIFEILHRWWWSPQLPHFNYSLIYQWRLLKKPRETELPICYRALNYNIILYFSLCFWLWYKLGIAIDSSSQKEKHQNPTKVYDIFTDSLQMKVVCVLTISFSMKTIWRSCGGL